MACRETKGGSITSKDALDAEALAEVLHNSMGTDKDAIINIIGNHTNDERQKIAAAYQTAYGKDLIFDLFTGLAGGCGDVVTALMTPRFKFDAIQIFDAMSAFQIDERTYIEIICTKSNAEIEQIKEEYKKNHLSELEEDLNCDDSGFFSILLSSTVARGRESDEGSADQALALFDAQTLYAGGESHWGTDDADINAILSRRSYCQLLETFNAFEAIAGKTIEESIRAESSPVLTDGYLAFVQCVRDKPSYYAMRIHECMEGSETEENDLIRIIVSRSEIDMEDIKDAYKEKYGTTLEEGIQNDCDVDYKNILIAIVNKPDA